MQTQQRRDQYQRHPGHQPMGEDFADHEQRNRLGREQHLLEGPVAMIGREDQFERQHRGEQGANPQNTWRDQAQRIQFRADAQRKEADDDGEEDQGSEDIRAASQCDRQVAAHDQ
mgnify:CR=1 FL=1